MHSFETVVEAASLSASPGAAAVATFEVNFDTGAAVTVLPEKYVTQPRDNNGVRYPKSAKPVFLHFGVIYLNRKNYKDKM